MGGGVATGECNDGALGPAKKGSCSMASLILATSVAGFVSAYFMATMQRQ
jgi:hypothetical protein